jgi:hypothetical protein
MTLKNFNAIKQSLNPNHSQKWIEGAYAQFIHEANEAYFTGEDVVIKLLPYLNGTLFIQGYSNKLTAMKHV